MAEPFYTPPPQPGALLDGKRVYVSTNHACHYPVGCGSVAIAFSEPEARALLDTELIAHGLNPQDPAYTLQEIGQNGPVAVVLVDGQY